jgi:hypothetical protein
MDEGNYWIDSCNYLGAETMRTAKERYGTTTADHNLQQRHIPNDH